MGLLGKIFGSDKAIEGAVNGITKGLDALVYTDEEKAQDAAAERRAGREVLIEWFRTSKGQNLARRALAFAITGVWLVLYLSSLGLRVSAAIVSDDEVSAKIVQVASEVSSSAAEMNGAVMLILAFYFAAPHMGTMVEGAMKRFGGK